jgi:serpin B
MMKQLQEVNVLIDDEVTMLELPYGNETFSAIFIKPSRKDISIDQIISNKLTSEQLNNWITRLSKKKVEYFIPKFELEYKRELKEDLKVLGMNQVFAHKAELNNLFNDLDNLYVSSVLQKTFLKMDEQGAEAAAATSITVGRTSMPSYEEVKIDQPYLLIMREKTSGVILFMGKITIPNG